MPRNNGPNKLRAQCRASSAWSISWNCNRSLARPLRRFRPACLIAAALVCLGFQLALATATNAEERSPPDQGWQYGAYLDVGYGVNFNFPENHQWRSKQTTPRTNEVAPNMGLAYLRKEPRIDSRWGME